MYIKQTYSTSTLLREQYSDSLPHLYTIRTDYQTAGRGQAGNTWESEEGKNLLFSALLRYPKLKAAEQWRLSMLVALTVREVIASRLVAISPSRLTIKWPNDIYIDDKKLVGILIENMLQGAHVGYTIAGIGVNVNQTEWLSSAPNPISMKQITGEEYDVESLLHEWIDTMKLWENYSTEDIRQAYIEHLYRRQGWYPYVEREVSVKPTAIARGEVDGVFKAEFMDITNQGELVLRTQEGVQRTYHFKQVRFVI